MQLDTIRFGRVDIDERRIIMFKDGLPGLEGYNKFALMRLEDSDPIYWLQSAEDGSVCLPVVDSFSVLPDYAFNLDEEDVRELEVGASEDLHIISVLVIPDNIERMTMNLAAPIVINLKNGQARQVILNSGEYNARFPIFQEVCRLLREGDTDAGTIKEDK